MISWQVAFEVELPKWENPPPFAPPPCSRGSKVRARTPLSFKFSILGRVDGVKFDDWIILLGVR